MIPEFKKMTQERMRKELEQIKLYPYNTTGKVIEAIERYCELKNVLNGF